MKNHIKIYFTNKMTAWLIMVTLCLFTTFATAQDSYKVQKASVLLKGTSTLHDWEMKAEGFSCTSLFQMENNQVAHVKSLTLTIPVQTLKSGKGAMDKNAYSALKVEDHKQITYVITSSKVSGNKIICTGNLTIAGVTKPMEVESTYTVNTDNTIVCKTSKTFKMSEFNVEPPTFMFGSVTTGDEITMAFDLIFKRVNAL
ncbi:MAG TPA: YceI family protein [Chryseolinea sp.]|nr:YceI family protein [Chryseolinea sp.]